MSNWEDNSIFKKFFTKVEFIDRKVLKNEEGIDIIVPIINTNELFETNLYSWYREIPINRLLIGFGGGTDNSLEIAQKFPRVVIIDQSTKYSEHLYGSQGICIAELISIVETTWFIYLHADVYIPQNWYDLMKKYQHKYDWYESSRDNVILIQNKHEIEKGPRAYSGGQMGRKNAFKNIIPRIEDGYIQNNEDIIFNELILSEGYKYGRITETKFYHQIMNKRGEKEPKYKKVAIQREETNEWRRKIYFTMARGIIKYCKPKSYLIRAVNVSLNILNQQEDLEIREFFSWVKKTNSIWLKFIKIKHSKRQGLFKKIIIGLLNLNNRILNRMM